MVAGYSLWDEYFVLIMICGLYLQPFHLISWQQNNRDIRLLTIFLTMYLCITFHFFVLALGENVVFYFYEKNILMLPLRRWTKCSLKQIFFSGTKCQLKANNKNLGKRIKTIDVQYRRTQHNVQQKNILHLYDVSSLMTGTTYLTFPI